MKADAIGICDGKDIDLDFARLSHRYLLCAYDLRGFALFAINANCYWSEFALRHRALQI